MGLMYIRVWRSHLGSAVMRTMQVLGSGDRASTPRVLAGLVSGEFAVFTDAATGGASRVFSSVRVDR